MDQPTTPQQPPQQPSVLSWLQQLPPWLPPLLWLAGGGTIGAGGLQLAGDVHQPPHQQHHLGAAGGSCLEQVTQLQAVTTELAHHLAICECTCARD